MPALQLDEFKTRQRAVWDAGEYSALTQYIAEVGELVVARAGIAPEMKVLDVACGTGNDFGIDMVMYGSDYLLGLSTFAPDLFARRDACWLAGDPAFYELNDLLQYLGFFAFRSPGPGYKHSAAQFLKIRGWISTNRTHPESPKRPDTDIPILAELVERLGILAK
jgi:hypothetical protein